MPVLGGEAHENQARRARTRFHCSRNKGEHCLPRPRPAIRRKQQTRSWFVASKNELRAEAIAEKRPGRRPLSVDQHNKPIAGASVEAFTPVVGFMSSFSMPTGRDYFPDLDRVDTTDEQGRFRIVDLPTSKCNEYYVEHRYVGDTNYPVEEGLIIVMSGSGEPA